jgi:dienelactone hydrolase
MRATTRPPAAHPCRSSVIQCGFARAGLPVAAMGSACGLSARGTTFGRTAAALLAVVAGTAGATGGTLQRDLVFEHASPLARPEAVLERMTSPTRRAVIRARVHATRAGDPDPWPALDLATERFAMFVPAGAPPDAGFGLVVFVPPWEGQGFPVDWLPALQRHGFMMATASRSGNAQEVGARRIPLALTAVENARRRQRVDPARVYVAGFSGGARVALRIALAYPDVFRGAVLNAGSDPLGTADVPLPEPTLFDRFERGSRLVYISGTLDAPALAADRASRGSARGLCIPNTEVLTVSGGRHEPADAHAFGRALDALAAPLADPAGEAACRARRARVITREAGAITALVDAGRLERAQRRLLAFDARWAGLAATASTDIAARLHAAQGAAADP